MFSKTPSIAAICSLYDIENEPDYHHNRFNLPILRSLILYAREHYASKYYGYINSDILLSPDVFEALEITSQKTKLGQLRSMVALCIASHAALYCRKGLRCVDRGRGAVVRDDGELEAVLAGHSSEVGTAEH